MAQELSGKIAIVTGAANGIGRATAELFVQEGARVVIADIDEARGSQLASALGGATRFKRTDVSAASEVQALVDFAVAEFGGLHIMVNNAGLSDDDFGRLLDKDLATFDRVLHVNLLGVMLGTQFAARIMAKAGGGSIINTSSLGGVRAGYGFMTYRAAKAAVMNFSQSAAIDLGEYLIRVNCICPGNIPTQMGSYATPAPGMTQAAADRIRKAVDDVRLLRQPLKRQGRPIDVAQTALFLGSDRSQQISGMIMLVDGAAGAGNPINQIQEMLDARVRAISD